MRDITERKEAEQKNKRKEGQLQTIFNEAPDALIVINEDIIRWNPKAEQILMVIDRGFRKINCRIDHARKIQKNLAVGLKIFFKLAKLLLLIKPWKLLR
jgi:hypothetical protein